MNLLSANRVNFCNSVLQSVHERYVAHTARLFGYTLREVMGERAHSPQPQAL
jgi:hypothetical protein